MQGRVGNSQKDYFNNEADKVPIDSTNKHKTQSNELVLMKDLALQNKNVRISQRSMGSLKFSKKEFDSEIIHSDSDGQPFLSDLNDNYSLGSFVNVDTIKQVKSHCKLPEHEKKEDSISFRKKQSLSELSEIESQSVVSEPKKIKKRIHKLKNFWRGSSLFYPFSFQKVFVNDNDFEQDGVFGSFFIVNDLSRKIISFSNKLSF